MNVATRWSPLFVSIIVATTFGVVMVLLLTRALPNADSDLMKVFSGVLSAKFGDVVNYWIGSSAGSRSKDEIIARKNDQPPNPQ